MRAAIVLALLMAAVTPAACGSSGGGEPTSSAPAVTKAGYIVKADVVCKDADAAVKALNAQLAGLTGEEQFSEGPALLRKGAELTRTGASDLEAIEPPPTDVARITAWLGGLAARATLLDQIADAVDKRDTATSRALSARLATNAATAQRFAARYGFKVCGAASG